MTDFQTERKAIIDAVGKRQDIRERALWLIEELTKLNYAYCFDWLGLPIIQSPFDIVQIQHLIWETKPDVIVETGVARGGSLVLSASMLKLLDKPGKVIGVDIDIRDHARKDLAEHPLSSYIHLIQGDSTAPEVIAEVKAHIQPGQKVLVMLDSDHGYDHVRKELACYSPLVKKGSYLIVMDTVIEDLPEYLFTHRHWGAENNPKRAVRDFVAENPRFRIRSELNDKLLLTAAMDGYLECISD